MMGSSALHAQRFQNKNMRKVRAHNFWTGTYFVACLVRRKKRVSYPYQQHSLLCLLETDLEMRSSFASDLRSKGANAFFVKSCNNTIFSSHSKFLNVNGWDLFSNVNETTFSKLCQRKWLRCWSKLSMDCWMNYSNYIINSILLSEQQAAHERIVVEHW